MICTLSSAHWRQASTLTALLSVVSSFLTKNSAIQKLSIIIIINIIIIIIIVIVVVVVLVVVLVLVVIIIIIIIIHLQRFLCIYYPAGIMENDRADRLSVKSAITSSLRLGRSEVLIH